MLPPLHHSAFSEYSKIVEAATLSYSLGPSGWVTNLIIYTPIIVPWPYPMKRIWVYNGTSIVGNIDLGLYSRDGTKLISTGSTAAANASAIQYINATYLVPPGMYYLAHGQNYSAGGPQYLNVSLFGPGQARSLGVLKQESTFPLPAKATFASTTYGVGPIVMGMTLTESGF